MLSIEINTTNELNQYPQRWERYVQAEIQLNQDGSRQEDIRTHLSARNKYESTHDDCTLQRRGREEDGEKFQYEAIWTIKQSQGCGRKIQRSDESVWGFISTIQRREKVMVKRESFAWSES
jgi:hypothetical protein